MTEHPQGPSLGGDRYVLTRRLGEGGMATVFLAWDTKLKVWRAIKVLLPEYVSKKRLRKRFENEAHAMARLEHPNIIRIYDVGLEGKVPYMVMELAEGGCVIDWLKRYGPMPPRLALEVALQLCAGVESAHEAGIVHRDLKPHNILVSRTGTCKITDFGIAQVMDQDALTKTGSVMGTWGFMAPEQRIDAKNVDHRADVFGIGATLYNLLTDAQPTELYVAEQDDEVFDDVPSKILPIILEACRYKAKDRYQDVATLRAALAAVQDEFPELPDDLPSLVLEVQELPDSVESAYFSPTILEELHDALGNDVDTQDDTNPGITAQPQAPPEPEPPKEKVLPYYMPSTRPVADVPNAAPSYIDQEELEKAKRTPRPAPVPKAEPISAPVEPEPDYAWVKYAIPVVVTLVLLIAMTSWGAVVVNGAERQYFEALSDVDAKMSTDLQGAVIDGLALAGGNKRELEAALTAYARAKGPDRLAEIEAYLITVQRHAMELGSGPTVDKLRPVITELEAETNQARIARQDWSNVAKGFPGVLAVWTGMADSP